MGPSKPYRGVNWNGRKIYLSPARHSNAGSRGECDDAKNENEMAFYHAWDATNAPYYQDVYSPNHRLRNLRAMGYKVKIGTGTVQTAITRSNRWGATRHVPLHSNAHAYNDCNNTNAGRFGTVGIYRSGSNRGYDLANKIKNRIGAWTGTAQGNVSPGTNDYVCYNPGHPCTDDSLAELRDTRAPAASSSPNSTPGIPATPG